MGSYIGKSINFTDLVVFDENHIVATGIYSSGYSNNYQDGDSAFMYSLDGGLTWNNSSYDAYQSDVLYYEGFDGLVEFYSMVKTGENSAVAVGQDGFIVLTNDRGQTWTTVDSPTDNDLVDVDAYNGAIVAVGDEGTAVISKNNGETWFAVDSLGEDLLSVDLVDDSFVFYVVATQDKVYRRMFSDFFSQWVKISDLKDQFADDVYQYWKDDITIVDMDFYSYDKGAISTNFSESYLTEDGGKTWELANFYALDASQPWYADDEILDLHYEGSNTLYGFGVSDLYTDGYDPNGSFYKYNFSDGALIKMHCGGWTARAGEGGPVADDDPCKAVYYLDENGIRHPFLNEESFYGWYDDFSDLIEVDDDYMAELDLGDAVPYRPGAQFIKFYTSDAVYAVRDTGGLRRVANEAVAQSIISPDGSEYGESWSEHIVLGPFK